MKQYFSLNIDEYHNFGDKDNLSKKEWYTAKPYGRIKIEVTYIFEWIYI